ncbi:MULTISPECIES: hypothetical protein [unclassified Acidovorax]|nr:MULTISPECIES: hypothetical protein [unclassified Acidovorax]
MGDPVIGGFQVQKNRPAIRAAGAKKRAQALQIGAAMPRKLREL